MTKRTTKDKKKEISLTKRQKKGIIHPTGESRLVIESKNGGDQDIKNKDQKRDSEKEIVKTTGKTEVNDQQENTREKDSDKGNERIVQEAKNKNQQNQPEDDEMPEEWYGGDSEEEEEEEDAELMKRKTEKHFCREEKNQTERDKNQLVCRICGARNDPDSKRRDEAWLVEHWREKHKGRRIPEEDVDRTGGYICKWCGKTYINWGHEVKCKAKGVEKADKPIHKEYQMGNSKKRSNLDWVEIAAYVKRVLGQIGPKTVVAFLDGSSTRQKGTARSGA